MSPCNAPLRDWQGRRVWLVGASSGIGQALAEALHAAGDLNLTLANATVYLEAFGHLVMGWIWLEQHLAADGSQGDVVDADADFYAGKRQACLWFHANEVPKVDAQLDLLASLDATALQMQDAWF